MEKIFNDPDILLPALAEFVVEEARSSIAARGRFSFLLSGGGSPKKLYEILASPSFRTRIEWTRVFFFFGDERNVPQDHPDSNYRMVKLALFDPLNISPANIFPIDTALSPTEAADAYQTSIINFFAGESERFDLILLGLGDNSHTASLFPYTVVLHEKSKLVAGLFIEEVHMFRITVTAPLINLGRKIVFLVYGAGKADAVHHILKEPLNIEKFPAQLIHPAHGDVIWFLDESAAARLK